MNCFVRSRTWIIVGSFLVIAASLFSYRFFPQAFPIITISISMDRSSAITNAHALAKKFNIGPEEAHSSALFATDTIGKTFVELEGGGKHRLTAIMQEKKYYPYTWQIRLFSPHKHHEATIAFTPDGTPYDFAEIIPEDVPGAALSKDAAQQIAQQKAQDEWNIDLKSFALVESSQEVRQSKRVDHQFTYERTDDRLNEGTFRLRLTVSGDTLTGISHFIKVPDSFTRRYQHMRSANENIAHAAQFFIYGIYILLCVGFGLFFLFRARRLIVRPAAWWAMGIAVASTFARINEFPLIWMEYDTAVAPLFFIFKYIAQLCISFCFQAVLLTILFVAAESLTRTAFGAHLQLWKLWSPRIAGTNAVVGRTLLGYGIVAFDLAYVTLFYLITSRYFGWWIPSQTIFDPNVLATYFPWFTPLAQSLSAGFIEECLFRAIPLSCAAIIGRRFGKERCALIAVFLLQAVVFGAAHANYPGQPSYARLVELIIPSFVFGGLYLAYGLLPAIISHFVYDAVLFSLPLFVAHIPGIWVHRALIIIAALIPAWIVLYARWKGHPRIHTDDYNSGWQPPVAPVSHILTPKTTIATFSFSLKQCVVSALIGATALVVWYRAVPKNHDALPISISAPHAVRISRHELAIEGTQWRTLPLMPSEKIIAQELLYQHRYIRKHAPEQYHTLLGTYLFVPHWVVRYARFEGELVERAEQYYVHLNNENQVSRILHLLPEESEGAHLSEQEAYDIAHHALMSRLAVAPSALTFVSAVSHKLPARTDWHFTFADTQAYQEDAPESNSAQARIGVIVSGNQITDIKQYMHLPEQWERAERSYHHAISLLASLSSLVFSTGALGATAVALGSLTSAIPAGTFLYLIVFLILHLLTLINGIPSIMVFLNTAQPLVDQLFRLYTPRLISMLVQCAGTALALTVVARSGTMVRTNRSWFMCTVWGGVVAAAHALMSAWIPSAEPVWPTMHALNSYLPGVQQFAASLISNTKQIISVTALFMGFSWCIKQYTFSNTIRSCIEFVCCTFVGFMFAATIELYTLPLWIALGCSTAAVFWVAYQWGIRHDATAMIPLMAMYGAVQCAQEALFNAYPYAWISHLISAVSIIMLGYYLFNYQRAQAAD